MIAGIFITACFLTLIQNSAAERCEALDNSKVHPYSCCKYPMFRFEQSDVQTCQQETCNGKAEAELMACMNTCIIGDLWVDGAVNLKKVEKIFTDSATERTLSEDSLALLETTIEKVATTLPKEMATHPQFPVIFLFHVMGENYSNCPKMEEKEECEELRGAVEECTEKNEIENYMEGFAPPK